MTDTTEHEEPAGPAETPRRRGPLAFWTSALFVVLALAVVALVVGRETDRAESLAHQGRIGLEGVDYTGPLQWKVCLTLSVVATLLILVFGLGGRRLLRRRLARGVAVGSAAVFVLLCGLAYFYVKRGVVNPFYPHLHDTFHYLLGAKYFKELGYFDLYECALMADREMDRHVKSSMMIRDLRTYRFVPAGSISRQADCHESFGVERWRAFKRDVKTYNGNFEWPHYLRRVLQDRGYNGTPFHTLLAGRLAHVLPVTFENLNYYALVDVVGLCAMLALVTWAFGWRFGFACAVFFFLNFSDRQVFTGGAHFRYAWLTTLGLGIAALKLRRHAIAAVLMTVSAMLNVFPLFFVAGVALRGLTAWVRERRLPRSYRRFAVACALTAVIGTGLGMAHGRGVRNYSEFVSFIGDHADKLTYSRVGFRYVFLFRGEFDEDDPDYVYSKKVQDLERLRPLVWSLTGLVLLAGLGLVTRLQDHEAAILSGILLFFFLFGTVEYYYAALALLILLWQRWARAPGAVLFVALLFLINVLNWIHWIRTEFYEFCNNTITSVGLTSYLLGTIVYLGFRSKLWGDVRRWVARLLGRTERQGRRRPVLEALAVGAALAVTPLGVAAAYSRFDPSGTTSRVVTAEQRRAHAESTCSVERVPEVARIEPREFGPLRLVGLTARGIAGERPFVSVVTYWQPAEALTEDLTLFQSAARAAAEGAPVRSGGMHRPCAGRWPTSRWGPGKLYRDSHALRLPAGTPTERLRLTLGVRRGGREIDADHDFGPIDFLGR